MTTLELWCDHCQRDTPHLVNKWWTGKRHSHIANLCLVCKERLELHELGKGYAVDIEAMEQMQKAR